MAVLLFLGTVFINPGSIGSYNGESPQIQTARTIALAMYAYSNDHDQRWPDGRSSTEVFQKLLDGKYVSDPTLFYFRFPGKVNPLAGKPLKPENVCWDVTVHADLSGLVPGDPDSIPLLFTTGCRIDYIPGGKAVPLILPYPVRRGGPRQLHGLAVAYKSNVTQFLPLDSNNIIPDVFPENFDAQGKTYRQLTPDGVLP